MARKSPRKKKQTDITTYSSHTASSGGGGGGKRKKSSAKKKSAGGGGGGGGGYEANVPPSRTWIYAATAGEDDGLGNTEEGYEEYLNQRVQRPAVRSLAGNFSYFTQATQQGVQGSEEAMALVEARKVEEEATTSAGETPDEGGAPIAGDDAVAAAAAGETPVAGETPSEEPAAAKGEEKEAAVPLKSEEEDVGGREIQQSPPNPTNLAYAYVPLPHLVEANDDKKSGPGKSDGPASTSSADYAKFTAPIITKDNRIAKFQFGLNYGNHVPGKNLISYVGGYPAAGSDESGYVLQMPLITGTVIGYSPPLIDSEEYGGGGEANPEEAEFPTQRQKADIPLFRILWDGHSTSSSGSSTTGYTEDVTLSELLPSLIAQPDGLSTKQRLNHKRGLCPPYSYAQNTFGGVATITSSVEATNVLTGASMGQLSTTTALPVVLPAKLLSATASSIHKHIHATVTRKQLSLEWKMENEILPHLVVLAALELRKELAQKVRLEMLLERKRLRMESGLEKRGKRKGGAGGEEGIVNENGSDFGYYARHPHQYMSSFVPPPPLPSDDEDSDGSEDEEDEMDVEGGAKGKSSSSRKSKTKLTQNELITYNAKLDEQCHFAPSKIAERVKLSCSLAYDYVTSRGMLDEYYAESERRKEREREEKERMGRVINATAGPSDAVGGSGGRGNRTLDLGGIDGTGEVRRSGRARAVINYADDGTQAVETMLGEHEGVAVSGGKFTSGSLPRDNVSGGPTALYLLELLGMLPKEGEKTGDESMDDEDDEESNEEEGEEDPFFNPRGELIIDQLGRKQRYMSPASIQHAIVYSIEAHAVDTPSCLMDEEFANDGHHYVTDIICTSGDKVSDLGQFEPASFARCRFAPRTFVPEGDEMIEEEEDEYMESAEVEAAKKKRREEKRQARRAERKAAEQKRNAELERQYRSRKNYEIWRFRCIHGDGCTIFPSWPDRVRIGELLSGGGLALRGGGDDNDVMDVDYTGSMESGMVSGGDGVISNNGGLAETATMALAEAAAMAATEGGPMPSSLAPGNGGEATSGPVGAPLQSTVAPLTTTAAADQPTATSSSSGAPVPLEPVANVAATFTNTTQSYEEPARSFALAGQATSTSPSGVPEGATTLEVADVLNGMVTATSGAPVPSIPSANVTAMQAELENREKERMEREEREAAAARQRAENERLESERLAAEEAARKRQAELDRIEQERIERESLLEEQRQIAEAEEKRKADVERQEKERLAAAEEAKKRAAELAAAEEAKQAELAKAEAERAATATQYDEKPAPSLTAAGQATSTSSSGILPSDPSSLGAPVLSEVAADQPAATSFSGAPVPSEPSPNVMASTSAAASDPTAASNHRTEEVAYIPRRPDAPLPEGWVQRRVPRKTNAAKSDPYWFSPVMSYQFRSKAESNRFLDSLDRAAGNEEVAMELHVEAEKKRKASVTSTFDEELARSLAAADGDDEPLSKRRRTARRGQGEGSVFYGGHSSMSRDQLLDSLVRLVHQQSLQHSDQSGGVGSFSLMDLKRLIFPENYDTSRGGQVEMKKIRSALGHLVYRCGRLGRLMVDATGDGVCLDMLKVGPLVKFVGEDGAVKMEEQAAPVGVAPDASATSALVAAPPAPIVDEHLKSQLLALEQYIANLHRTELSLRRALMKAFDKNGKAKKGDAALTLLQISTLAIATSADEVEGNADAEDWRDFLPKREENGNNGNGKAVKWSSNVNDHPLLGKVIYRPQSSPLRPSEAGVMGEEKCHWYRIVAFTPSAKAATEAAPLPPSVEVALRSNTIVERRARFRAVPVAESDVDEPYVAEEMDSDDDDVEYMVLTEGQARAGMDAALLHRSIEGPSASATVSGPPSANNKAVHPYRNGHGSRVMLTPVQSSQDGQKFEVLYGIIAGYDHSIDGKYKMLILLDKDEDQDVEMKVEGDEDAGSQKKEPSVAFWSTVDAEGTTLTDIDVAPSASAQPTTTVQLCPSYTIEMHEYFAGSPAYDVCDSLITYMKNHSKSQIFLAPVDPVALGIPDYFSVITSPMDITTLASNLEEGRYSRIPPRKSHDGNAEDSEEEDYMNSPVYRMAYGPFYDATMLIFDNCIKYNGPESFYGNEAAAMKKNTIKKLEQLVNKALWSGQGQQPTRTTSRSTAGIKKRSVYAEVDSDEEMYEYESEYDDDEDYGGKRRSRKAKRSQQGGTTTKKRQAKEDISMNAIEAPFVFPENAHEYGSGIGPFPHIKVQTNVNKFTLSSNEWSCRYIKEEESTEQGAGEGEDAEAKQQDAEEEEMLLLMQMQQEEDAGNRIRRSTRERHAPKNYADEGIADTSEITASYTAHAPVTLPGVEYYLMNDAILRPKQQATEAVVEGATIPSEGTSANEVVPATTAATAADTTAEEKISTTCRSRLGAEGILETIHEAHYARLYRDQSPNALILDNDLGKYANGSFPPYLGRVVPNDGDESIVWEIREQYLIPALRWVLRGLVQSGHLSEVEGTLSDGTLEEAPARSSPYGVGVVVPSHEYYYPNNDNSHPPFDVLDEKEISRKRRQDAAAAEESSSEEEVELSAYEQARAERVARNAERLRALGLA